MRKRCAPLHLLSSSTRLWCVVELFCFLKNGGDIDRVTVLPVVEASNDTDEAAADATRALQRELGRFRVERARCSQERDTQKLLGCIVRARHSATPSLAHARRATPSPLPPWRGRRLGSASTSRSTRWCAASSPAGRAPASVLQAFECRLNLSLRRWTSS